MSDAIPASFIEGGPIACAVASADEALRLKGVTLSREHVIGVTIAAIVGFAFSGGLADDQITRLRQIVAKVETATGGAD